MGYDLVLTEEGPALAVRVDPDTKSGNPTHNVRDGRFGSLGRRKAKVPGSNPRATQVEAGPNASQVRRRDAVVDAARTIMDLSPDGVREFVRKRWRGTRPLTDADVESFSADARRQRIEDAVDALDYRIRRGVYGRTRVVKVDFPRGLIRGSLRNMDDTEVNEVLQRLRYRGWTIDQVKRHVIKPYALRDRDVLTGLSEDD
jgi:hypothetical protein